MKTRNFLNVRYNGITNKVECETLTDFGVVNIKRTPRKHNKELREEQLKGIYSFEIQGVMYCYKVTDNGYMEQYREPENFRSEQRTTNIVRTSGRNEKHKIEVKENSVVIEKEEIREELKPVQVKEEEQKEEEEKEIRHKEYDTIKTCIENDIPVYLVGEAGTGKNYTLESIAWDLGMDFYFTNSVQQEYKLTGFIDAGGTYHETEFYKAFKNGGIFFLDEIDASIPEVLVLLNAAIANRYFEFPTGRIEAHENFRVVAAGNTVGSGADELYTGRLVLDQATLDRFVIIEFDYDRNVEMHLAKNDKELVDFVEGLRKQARNNGIRATFSYRCIMMVKKLTEANMELTKVLKIAVFKGLEKDTINCFMCEDLQNKYFYKLRELQVA